MGDVRPQIRVLTAEQIEQVHEYSLKILSSAGVRVDSEQARRVFVQSIGTSSKDTRVRIPGELVEHALQVAPSALDLYDRRGNLAFRLGDAHAQTYFGIGVTNLYYQEPDTDAVAPFTRKHMEIATRLGETLVNFDLVSTPGSLQDISPETADLYGTLEMIANTTKPLVILVSDPQRFQTVLDLLQHLHGDLGSHPFVIPYVNPITPLIMNKETTDKMFSAIERGVPLIYSNYGMAGSTTPITPASTLVMLNAELLAGLVLTQLIKEGAPVIMGSLPASFDMKNMGTLYTPQTMLLNLACAEMMAYYAIPHCGTSGSGTGWGPDLLASGTLWMNHLTSCLGKVGLAPFMGGNFDSVAFSPATIVYSDEIIRQARLFSQGFSLDDASVALDEIDAAGPGGDFLTSGLTLKLFRKMHFQSHIWPTFSFEKWQTEDSPKAVDVLRKHTQDLLAGLRAPEDHDELIAAGEAFITSLT